PRIKAISSECEARLAPHFHAADGSLLRPERGQWRDHCQTVGKERLDIRRHSHEALRAPRSSGNGLPRQPAADVTGERPPDYRRDCAHMTSYRQHGRNMKPGPAIARRSRGNSPNPRPAWRARFGRGAETAAHSPFLSKVSVPDRLAAVETRP